MTNAKKTKQIIVGKDVTLILHISIFLLLCFFALVFAVDFSVYFVLLSFLFLSIFLEKAYRNHKWKMFVNVRVLFLVFLFLYTNFYPIFYVYFNLDLPIPVNVSLFAVRTATILGNISICTAILLLHFIEKKDSQKRLIINLEAKLKKIKPGPLFFIIEFIAAVYIIYYIFQIISSNAIGIMLSGVDRVQFDQTFQIWTHFLFDYIVVAYACFIILMCSKRFFLRQKISRMMYLRLALCALYYGFSTFLGHRRLLMYVLIFTLICVLIFSKRIQKRYVIGSVAGLALFVSVGYLRNVGFSFSNIFSPIAFFSALGEFMIPINTLYYFIDNPPDVMFGASYLMTPLVLIPSGIWNNKPDLLAVRFADLMGGTMGYGYSPLTEAFINFSYLGFFLFPIILFIIIIAVEKSVSVHPMFYLMFLIQCMNFNRGEFSAVFIEAAIMCGALCLMCAGGLKKKRSKIFSSKGGKNAVFNCYDSR